MGWRAIALAATGLLPFLLAGQDPRTTRAEGPETRAANPAGGVATTDPDPAAADLARMQGVWTMSENVVNGIAASERQRASWLLVVEGAIYNPGSGEISLEYRFRLDPTRTPKAIDLYPVTATDRSKHYRGIYAVEGDQLTVCRPLELDEERPAGFGARAGSNLTRVVWKRRKGR